MEARACVLSQASGPTFSGIPREMGLGLYLRGDGARDAWMATASAWLADNTVDPFERPVEGRDREGRPVLRVILHPGAEAFELIDAGDGALIASAATTPVGPGYHAYVCQLLRGLGAELGLRWAPPGEDEVDGLSSESVESVATCDGVSSVRFYAGEEPDDLNSDVLAVYYPEPPKVLDAVDIVPRLARWLLSTDQTMGNWISKAELQNELGQAEIEETTVSESLPVDELEPALERSGAVTAIGLDVLQIPRCKLTLTAGSEAEGS